MIPRSTDPLKTALGLQDLIRTHRHATEQQRRLAEPIVEALLASGLGRMALPQDLGGLAASPVDGLAVLEALAEAEAAVGWVVWNSSLPCWFARFLAPQVRREIFGESTALFASSTRPTGRAAVKGDGYILNGRWSLVSGCMHAEWIPVMCIVEREGEVQMIAPGVPAMRMAFVPKIEHDIIDTWHVGGLRGTGSHDTVLRDVHVPAERTFSIMEPSQLEGPHGRSPIVCVMAAGCAAICLGIASQSLQALVALGVDKVSVDPGPGLKDRPPIQSLVARVQTKLDALRAHLRTSCAAVWDRAVAGENSTLDLIGALWSAAITAAGECRSAVSEIYAAAGTSSLYTDNPIERAHRDIHAVNQHIALQPFWLEQTGRVRFGLEPTHPLFAV